MSNDDYVVGRAYGEMAPSNSALFEMLLKKAERERDEAREQLRLANIDFFNTRAELEEQARLLGMGSEREARLITERDEALATLKVVEQSHHSALYREGELKRERDHYKKALEDLLSSTEKWANSNVPTNQSLDFIKQISRQIKKKLNNL